MYTIIICKKKAKNELTKKKEKLNLLNSNIHRKTIYKNSKNTDVLLNTAVKQLVYNYIIDLYYHILPVITTTWQNIVKKSW